ncbi:MAG: hypothetical protein HC876_18385 [Chloroflexaceae bacterium]|nr:hypothetical protein [Chloroflexaceae bacterium]
MRRSSRWYTVGVVFMLWSFLSTPFGHLRSTQAQAPADPARPVLPVVPAASRPAPPSGISAVDEAASFTTTAAATPTATLPMSATTPLTAAAARTWLPTQHTDTPLQLITYPDNQVLAIGHVRHPNEQTMVNDTGEIIRFVPSALPPTLTTDLTPQLSDVIINNRRQVLDTTIVPYRWVVNIEIRFPGGAEGFCSGWFYAPYSVATAGHCIYNRDLGGWADILSVNPGRNTKAPPPYTEPFPTCHAVRVMTNNI